MVVGFIWLNVIVLVDIMFFVEWFFKILCLNDLFKYWNLLDYISLRKRCSCFFYECGV